MNTEVKNIMTKKIVTARMGMSVHDAHLLMVEKRIRHLPVIDMLDDIVGVISLKDVCNRFNAKNITVESVMSTPIEYVEKDLPLSEAIFRMLELKISSLLVADDEDFAIGIVTTDDLLWYLAHLLSEEEKASEKSAASPSLKERAVATIGEVANELSSMGI